MRTWLDLESRFRALTPELQLACLDMRWGAVEDYTLSGKANPLNMREFETLCAIGGLFLQRSLNSELAPDRQLLAQSNPKLRWYLFLRSRGAVKDAQTSRVTVPRGKKKSLVFAASIAQPAQESANQCLHLHVNSPMRDDRRWSERVYDEYGKTIVITATATTIGAIAAALVGLFVGLPLCL